jgi:uncharacterized membrane protein (GlpM family)
MTYLIIKAALSGIIVMIVYEVSRRNPSIGGLIASLPLISILAFIWLWRDTSDSEKSRRRLKRPSGTFFRPFRCFLHCQPC